MLYSLTIDSNVKYPIKKLLLGSILQEHPKTETNIW
jgi:hypothetical protein